MSDRMPGLGATVGRTPEGDGMAGAAVRAAEVDGVAGVLERAWEFETETPGAFAARQFENPANPDFHEQTTAVEIWQQMDGRVDAWVSGIGSAGGVCGGGGG